MTSITSTFSPDQSNAWEVILGFLNDPGDCDALVLRGYAGTGKTYLLKKLIQHLGKRNSRIRIAMTAPTNKAVNVLSAGDELKECRHMVCFETIHKLLGLQQDFTSDGRQIFRSKTNRENDMHKFNIVVVDEASMLNDELCLEILENRQKTKLLFVGDPAQIPPVGQEDCIPFRRDHEFNFKIVELTQIMRQAEGNPIIGHSLALRKGLKKPRPVIDQITSMDSQGHGLMFLDSLEDKDKIRPLLKEWFDSDQFRIDANYAKVVAWRNVMVTLINGIIREILYGVNPPEFVVGEKLLVNKPIMAYGSVDLNTSEELRVTQVSQIKKNFESGEFSLIASAWRLRVEAYDADLASNIPHVIYIIIDVEEHAELIKQARAKALKSRSKQDWAVYYNVLGWTADVVYNYAITAHKSQGSTYQNVLVMKDDLDKNSNVEERNRITYTASTRASKLLVMFGKVY